MMQALNIRGDSMVPTVIFDPKNSRFEITGKSVPENAEAFYRPILDWMDEYAEDPEPSIDFMFHLDYFNIASSKRILFILFKLNELVKVGAEVSIKWHYREDDEDMWEVGRDLSFMVKIPFEFVEHPRLEPAYLETGS